MLPVADMRATTLKVLHRLETIDAPPAMRFAIGWDGARIMANLGDYNKLVKGLPSEQVTIRRGADVEEANTLVAIAVARLQVSLRGKTGKLHGRKPKGGHAWRTQARRDGVARGGAGE